MFRKCKCALIALVFLTFQSSNTDGKQQYSNRYRNKYGYENREELVIGDVTSYAHFEVGRGVFKWKSVTIEGKNYAVGLMETGICIFTAEMGSNGTVIVKNMTDSSIQSVDANLIKHWNSTSKIYEPIVTLFTNSLELQWFQITDDLELVKIFEWSLGKKAMHINVFKVNDQYHLLVMKKHSRFTGDVYRIKFNDGDQNEIWISQILPLRYTSQSSAFNSYESNHFLSIPQKDMVCVFKYDGGRFVAFANLSSPNVDYVNSFNLGLESYLLINGEKAGIYKFHSDGLTKENVENMSFDGINFWLPMTLTTYKDEIILLGQRMLDHESHKSKKIEIILKSGGKFYLYEEIPCRYYGDVLHGIDCLVEEENHDRTIKGATSLFFGKQMGIVLPRRDKSSQLFLLNISTRQLPNPVEQRMAELKSLRNKLEKMIEERQQTLEEIRKRLKNVEEKVDKSTEKVQFLNTSEASASGARLPANRNFSTGRTSESDLLESYEIKVDDIRKGLAIIKQDLKTAVRRDASSITVDELVFEDIVAVKGKSRVKDLKVNDINETNADTLFTNFVRVGDPKLITGEKTFSKLDVEKLDVKTVNNQSVENMAFNDESKTLEFKGDFIITNLVEVKGNVTTVSGNVSDDINLSEVLRIEEEYEDQIEFENVEAEVLQATAVNKLSIHNNYIESVDQDSEVDFEVYKDQYIPGNLIVQNINGEDLQDILDSVYMRNEKIVLYGKTVINGTVNVTHSADASYVNDIKFPEGYVFFDDKPKKYFMEVSGNKHFRNEISTIILTAKQHVNGIDTDTIVVRNKNQTLPGSYTFINLTVAGDVDVKGNITGIDVLPNPTIKETKVLKANVNFDVLEIEGTLTVENFLNGTRLEDILEDIVYKDEEGVTITSTKDFKEGLIVKDANIFSNKINEIPLDAFVDKTSEQVLNMSVLNGNVIVDHLFITGLFDGINISQLNDETVKLNGSQFISSSLTFADEVNVAGDFKINDSLNGIKSDAYIFKTGDRYLPSTDSLEEIDVHTLLVEGDFKGKISNFDIDKFDKNRISLVKDQKITEKYIVTNLHVDNLNASKINNYDYKDLTDPTSYETWLLERISMNEIAIQDLHIVGQLTVESINGLSMEDIMKACIYEGENTLKSTISFNDVTFNQITIENLNDIRFETFLENLIFKNETSIVFSASVAFLDGFEVTDFIETETINNKPLKHILRKDGSQKIEGPITIKGNVIVESNITVGENLNGIPMKYVMEKLEIIDENNYRIHDDVVFEKFCYINNLHVVGFINGKNWTKFLTEVIHIGDHVIVPGVISFTDKVQINNNLGIMEGINNKDLSKFVDDIVLTTYDDYIEGLVSFSKPVYILEEFVIESDLWCDTVMGIDVREWRAKALFINKGAIQGNLSFESVTVKEFLRTDFINTINMSTLIPLRTNQHIPEGLHFEEMSATQEVKVDNLINNFRFEPEFSNTLLNDGDQDVTSDIEFSDNVVVYQTLETSGPVNGIDLNKVVTINSNQNLTAIYNFDQKTVMHSNFNVYGLVNGIDVEKWKNGALFKEADAVQGVEGSLRVGENLTFENNLLGDGSIAGLDIGSIATVIENRKNFTEEKERQIAGEFGPTCQSINQILHKTKSQIYKFKYFDHLQFIDFTSSVGTVIYFQHESMYYMLVNEINSCKSYLFSWSNLGHYSLIRDDVQTGMLLQIIAVKDKSDSLYLVGRSQGYHTPCVIEGTNMWKFENVLDILHLHKLDNLLLLQESKIPGTFYGFSQELAFEFNIKSYVDSDLKIMRKWKIDDNDNLAYMPHNLATGLALRDGHRILKLLKEADISQNLNDHNTEEIAVEDVIEISNDFVPGRNGGDFIVLNVGKSRVRTLTALFQQEDTTVRGRFDCIKVYEDILHGKIFHKILTYKPSSLLAIEFGRTGETLLAFLEDQKLIRVYEYRGLEGFKLRSTIHEPGQKLMLMSLPSPRNEMRHILAVINQNRIKLMEAVMDGNSMEDEYLQCTLP
ncbi:hypothetical protein Trydic_g7135 [Trypoxylus dichotomus]